VDADGLVADAARNASGVPTVPSTSPPVIVLLSGGMDSAAVVAHYRAARQAVAALHVDYGQPARVSEWAAARRVATHYKTPVSRVSTSASFVASHGEFPCRNAFLVALAAGRLVRAPHVIALGIHADSPYYDCSSAFVADMQRILDGQFGGVVQLAAPFLSATKPEIYAWSRVHRVPLGLTYSCERRSRRPCGVCASCRDRQRLGHG
jgi:7-cyano-7-deazaguanine synthase